MPYKKRRGSNPNGFTIDEAQTATLLVTEGSGDCAIVRYKQKVYKYPRLTIKMCDREALEPASRVFKRGRFELNFNYNYASYY